MSDKSTFRNRRGHKVSISEAVDEISQQSEAPKPAPKKSAKAKPSAASKPVKSSAKAKTEPKPAKAKKPARSARSKKIWRRWLIIIGLLLVVLAGLGLMVTDGLKRDFERQAAAMRRQVTHLSKSTASQETAGSAVAKQLAQSLDLAGDCTGDSFGAAKWYTPARDTKQLCQTVARDYHLLRQELIAIEEEASYVETVASTLRDALKNPTSGTFASIPDYNKRWDGVSQKLDAMTAPDSIQSISADLNKLVAQIAKQWSQLQTANNQQDVAGFDAAEDAIAKSYQKLRQFDDKLTKPINDRQATIDELVDGLMIAE